MAVASSGPYANLHLAPDSTTPLSFFTGRTPFLPPNQQRQSTEGKNFRQQLFAITNCGSLQQNSFSGASLQLHKICSSWLSIINFFNTSLFKKQSALSLFLYLHSKQNLKFSVLLVKISKMYTVHSVIIWDKENRCSNLHWGIST